jgi:hypothetical protein
VTHFRAGQLAGLDALTLRTPMDVVTTVLPALTNAAGQWTPFTAAARLYDTLEIRTTMTPPIVMRIATMDVPDPNPVSAKLKPTLILSGPAGRRIIAPHGVATAAEGTSMAGFLLASALVATIGLGFVTGRGSARVVRTRDVRTQQASKNNGLPYLQRVAGLGSMAHRRRRRIRR